MSTATARIVPVADRGVLVEFSDASDEALQASVRAFDRRVRRSAPVGMIDVVPAYVSALVLFDPSVTDHAAIAESIAPLAEPTPDDEGPRRVHRIPVRYGGRDGPDLDAVAEALGRGIDEVVGAHVRADHRVVMFGFAPGAAYLGGVDPAIRLARKPVPVRDVPAGSVIIAGSQCLVMTVTMPTGWWVIGRTPVPTTAVGAGGELDIDVGDVVRFEAIGD